MNHINEEPIVISFKESQNIVLSDNLNEGTYSIYLEQIDNVYKIKLEGNIILEKE